MYQMNTTFFPLFLIFDCCLLEVAISLNHMCVCVCICVCVHVCMYVYVYSFERRVSKKCQSVHIFFLHIIPYETYHLIFWNSPLLCVCVNQHLVPQDMFVFI